jgi:hypothetical protein
MNIDNIVSKIIDGPSFHQFIGQQKGVSEKQRPYYLRWVAMFCEHARSLDAIPNQVDRDQFLTQIASTLEDWQELCASSFADSCPRLDG